jgi:hypothetical protein
LRRLDGGERGGELRHPAQGET